MKTFLTFFITLLSFISVNASHLLGGYIVAKQQSGRMHEITVVTLSDPTSPTNEFTNSIAIAFGDGHSEQITRTRVDIEEPGVNRNTYTTQHLYTTDGVFEISYSGFNLIANIVNVNDGSSDGLPFFISTHIWVNSSLNNNQTAQPLAYEKVNTPLNQTLQYNPTFCGSGDQEISYELIIPSNIRNYVLPEGSKINAYTGMLSFTPVFSGHYLFFIKCTSSQNGRIVARTTVAQLVSVKDLIYTLPHIEIPDVDFYSLGWYRRPLNVNETMSQPFTYSNINTTAEVYSELFNKNAADSITRPTNSTTTLWMNWTALPAYLRNTPYFATYRLRSTNNLIYDYNIGFYHGAPLNTAINDLAAGIQLVSAYPNPVTDGRLTLVFPESMIDAQLTVNDVLGKIVLSDNMTSNTYHIETVLWKSGLYTFTLQKQNGSTLKGKFIVE